MRLSFSRTAFGSRAILPWRRSVGRTSSAWQGGAGTGSKRSDGCGSLGNDLGSVFGISMFGILFLIFGGLPLGAFVEAGEASLDGRTEVFDFFGQCKKAGVD